MFDVCIGLTDTLTGIVLEKSAGYKPQTGTSTRLTTLGQLLCLQHDQPKYVNLTSGKAKAKIFQKWKINSRA